MRGKIINDERLNNILRKCRLVRQDKKKSSRSIPHVPCRNGMLLREPETLSNTQDAFTNRLTEGLLLDLYVQEALQC